MNGSLDGLMHELRPCGDGLDRRRIAAAVSGVLFGRAPVVSIGRFVVESRIGVGGMGIVYRGYDPKLDRQVAIKVVDLRRVSANPGVTQARLVVEARALAQLTHPNVVSVYDVGALDEGGEDPRVYLVMEYVEGPTLRAWMREPQSLERRLALLLAAGRGLAAAHKAGLIHGDFKPENILVGDDGRARVADFGLALPIAALEGHEADVLRDPSEVARERSQPDSTDTTDTTDTTDPGARVAHGEPTRDTSRGPFTDGGIAGSGRSIGGSGITLSGVFGTPAYIAPEQFLRARVDARADQFSFCVVACELLYGRRPFAGDSLEALGRAALVGEFLPFDDRRIPRCVRAVLRRGLAADPAARFSDMSELLAGLEAGFERRGRRRRRLLAAVAVSVLVPGLALGAGLWPGSSDDGSVADLVCVSAEARLEPVWTRARAESVAARIDAGSPHGGEAAQMLLARIDDQVRSWGAAWTRSCARVTDDASRERSQACLDARLLELEAVIGALTDPGTELRAPLAVLDELSPVASCLDAASLDAARPAPLEAGLRIEVDAVRNQLLGPATLAVALTREDAISLARQGLARATELGFRPLQAEAELALGRALWAVEQEQEQQGQGEEAVTMVERAHLSAEASRHSHVLAEAAMTRVQMAYYAADLDDGRAWLARAEAANEAAGDDPRLSVRLGMTACMFALMDGDYDLAIAQCERAQALVDQGARVDAHTRAVLIINFAIAEGAAGLSARAERRFEAAAVVAAAELDVERRDEMLAKITLHSGHLAFDRGDLLLALTRYRSALELFEQSGTPYGNSTAMVSIAATLRELGRLDDAQSAYTEVLTLGTATDDYWAVHQARSELAWIELERGRSQAAYEAWSEQLPSAREQLGAAHPWLLALENNIGEAQAFTGEVDEGLAKMDLVVAEVERKYGPEHAELAMFLGARAYVESRVGRWQICVDDYDRVLAIEVERVGAESPQIAGLQVERGGCRLELGEDPAELLPELEAAVEVLARGSKHSAEAAGRIVLGRAYLLVGDPRAWSELDGARTLLLAEQGDKTRELRVVAALSPRAKRLRDAQL